MANLVQMPEQWPQNRSNSFVLAMPLDALCHSLKNVLATRNEIGPATKEFISKVRSRFGAIASGETIEHLPAVSEEMSIADAYIAAELLRATFFCLLVA